MYEHVCVQYRLSTHTNTHTHTHTHTPSALRPQGSLGCCTTIDTAVSRGAGACSRRRPLSHKAQGDSCCIFSSCLLGLFSFLFSLSLLFSFFFCSFLSFFLSLSLNSLLIFLRKFVSFLLCLRFSFLFWFGANVTRVCR